MSDAQAQTFSSASDIIRAETSENP